MTNPYGLGGVQSPPDERDFQLSADFTPDELTVAIPPTFTVHNPGPIYDQHTSPQCVAYSAAGQQASFDLTETSHNYLWDFVLFFHRIHGTVNGAQIRVALSERVKRGYPLLPSGSGNSSAAHRISAYYAVTKSRDAIKRALVLRGTLLFGTPWFNSWFYPNASGVLPAADYQVGGHAIRVVGYDQTGVWLANSWGTDYGVNGRVHMSWSQVEHAVWEAWWAKDAASQ